ncbi:MAG: hypothetical protein WCX28_01655 [Bacteriovoracaceae bacterium]|nr:hypothetical protein [Bacteroidota bacterium]
MVSSITYAQDSSVISFIPEKVFVPSFTADGTAHRLSYAKDLSSGTFFAGLGGSFPAASVRYGGIECLIAVSGTVYTTLNDGGVKFRVTNADYYADVTFDFPITKATVLRLGSGHTSHHLVDDAVLIPGAAAQVINYARDYYQLFVVQNVTPIRGFVYGGTYYDHSYLVNVRKDGQFLFQFGADGGNLPLFYTLSLYGALDIKLRGAVNYGSTQSYQIGIRSKNENNHGARLAYTYRTGMEERGQFYHQRITLQSIGLFFDF